jgi:hypothetical protein
VEFPSSVTATDFSKVGVRTGDWAKYSFVSTNKSMIPSGPENLSFTNVTGTMVTLNVTAYNPDGSENSSHVYAGNVSNSMEPLYIPGVGNVSLPILYSFIIPANLSANDPIYDGAAISINDTESLTVANVSRVVNHVNGTSAILGTPYERYNMYWDKQTGIVVVGNAYIIGLNAWINMTLTATSLWHEVSVGGPIFGLSLWQLLIIGGVVAVVVCVSVLLLVRRRRRNPTPWIISKL